MEFLRFGSSIPGSYWGCCACDIIQNFNVDPDAKASIQLVSGDGGGPLMKGKEMVFAGPTYRDIFNTRIRIGTFGVSDMPNHAFLAIITESQCGADAGKKWLAILKEAGFEFIRAVDNSVYTGPDIKIGHSPHPNYIFGLFRNIGKSAVKDPMKPPAAWTKLPEQSRTQEEIWADTGPTKTLTETEVKEAGALVTLAGKRSPWMPQTREVRDKIDAHLKAGGQVNVQGAGGHVICLSLPKAKAPVAIDVPNIQNL